MILIVSFLSTKKGHAHWNYQCDCGKTGVISTGDFNRTRTDIKSCGCRQKGNPKLIKDRFFKKVIKTDGCWLFEGCIDSSGYGRCFKGSNFGENFAHRVSWTIFFGEIPIELKVLHKCDVRNCVNPEHLFLGTQKENVHDMIKKGRRGDHGASLGEKNSMSKLTNKDIILIRRNPWKISQKEMAEKFKVGEMTISRVVRGLLWKHI